MDKNVYVSNKIIVDKDSTITVDNEKFKIQNYCIKIKINKKVDNSILNIYVDDIDFLITSLEAIKEEHHKMYNDKK